MWLSQLKKKII